MGLYGFLEMVPQISERPSPATASNSCGKPMGSSPIKRTALWTTVIVLHQVFSRMVDDLPIHKILELMAQTSQVVRMPFGKHAGKPLSEVPKDYVEWLSKNGALDKKENAHFKRKFQQTRLSGRYRVSNMVILGCGYIGSEAASIWSKKGHHVTATTRSPEKLDQLSKVAQKSLILKGNDEDELIPLIANNELILVTIAADGAEHYESAYLNTAQMFRHLALEMDLPRHLIYTSSTSVYRGP